MAKRKLFFIIEIFVNDWIAFSCFRKALILETDILTPIREGIFKIKF